MSITTAPPVIEVHAPSQVRRWVRELPLLPLLILVPFVLTAVFADFIAPYDPTEPMPGAKIFEPPFWMDGGSTATLLGTDFQGRDVVEPADLRRPRVADRRPDGNGGGRQHRHRVRHPVRLSRRLGRPGHHAPHRRLAGPAGAGLRDLPGDHGRPQHVEHRHHPRARLLDPLCPRHPRRGAEPARARVRQAGRDRRRLARCA